MVNGSGQIKQDQRGGGRQSLDEQDPAADG